MAGEEEGGEGVHSWEATMDTVVDPEVIDLVSKDIDLDPVWI
jgi:hypothetical protein